MATTRQAARSRPFGPTRENDVSWNCAACSRCRARSATAAPASTTDKKEQAS